MEERIEFIEPVAVFTRKASGVALAMQGDFVYDIDGYWVIANLDAPSQARIEAAKKLALAHREAQKVADKVDKSVSGCFAIDRDGRKWEAVRDGASFACQIGSLELHLFLDLFNPTFYKPRPVVEKQVRFDGVMYVHRDGKWHSAAGFEIKGHFACALDRIAELEAQLEVTK